MVVPGLVVGGGGAVVVVAVVVVGVVGRVGDVVAVSNVAVGWVSLVRIVVDGAVCGVTVVAAGTVALPVQEVTKARPMLRITRFTSVAPQARGDPRAARGLTRAKPGTAMRLKAPVVQSIADLQHFLGERANARGRAPVDHRTHHACHFCFCRVRSRSRGPVDGVGRGDRYLQDDLPRSRDTDYDDTWGACRGPGCRRRHEGTDIMADKMVPIVAVTAGTVGWILDEQGGRCCAMAVNHDAGWLHQPRYHFLRCPRRDRGHARGSTAR